MTTGVATDEGLGASAREAGARAADDGIGTGSDPRPASGRRVPRPTYAVAFAAVLVLAAIVRLIPMGASLPYPGYVDEGHTIIHGADMVARGTADPEWYDYPTLPIAVSGAVVWITSLPASEPKRTRDIVDTASGEVYDDLRPSNRVLIGNRLVSVTFSLLTVAAVMVATARLVRRRVALVAGVFAALVPALVSRAGFDLVDTMATCFVSLAFLAGVLAVDARRPRAALAWTAAAGACCGLAAGSKYPAGAAAAMVLVLVVLARPGSVAERAVRGVVAAGATGLVFVATMPALILNLDAVRAGVQRNYDRYAAKTFDERYWTAAPKATEVGIALLVLAAVGTVLLLKWRRTRLPTVAWLVYSALLFGVAARLAFQPFRNIISIVPFLCIAAAVAVDAVPRALRRWQPSTPRWAVDAIVVGATAVVALLLVVGGVLPFHEASLVADSRREATNWLVENVQPGDSVTVMAELAIAKHDLDRIPGAVTVVSAVDGEVLRPATDPVDPDGEQFVVTGTLKGTIGPWLPEVEGGDELARVANFGRTAVTPDLNTHRGRPEVLIFQPG